MLPAFWKENVLGSSLTTIKIGGNVRYVAYPSSELELLETVKIAQEMSLKIKILGAGSNVIISDDGFSGLIIISRFEGTKVVGGIENGELEVGSGEPLGKLINFCIENGLSGAENFARIPCQVGGATVNNIHGMNVKLWSEYVLSVQGIDLNALEPFELLASECEFGYDQSIFQQKSLFISKVVLKFPYVGKTQSDILRQSYLDNLQKKSVVQPVLPNSGCAFKNLEKSAGWYIDQLGYRGFELGGVAVHTEHGNFIVNKNGGTAREYLELSKQISQKALEKYGVKLEEEVEFVGEGLNG